MICRECGAEFVPGHLLEHVKAAHPLPEVTTRVLPRICRRVGCVEVYGPMGHLPGVEGPCAY